MPLSASVRACAPAVGTVKVNEPVPLAVAPVPLVGALTTTLAMVSALPSWVAVTVEGWPFA